MIPWPSRIELLAGGNGMRVYYLKDWQLQLQLQLQWILHIVSLQGSIFHVSVGPFR